MNAIQKISKRAKAIQRSQPGKAWKNCIKQASADYRAGKLGGSSKAPKKKSRKVGAVKLIEKGESRNAKPTKIIRVHRTKKGLFKGTSLAGVSSAALKAELKNKLKHRLSMQLLSQAMATTKTNRRKAGKLVAETKRQLKKLD